jgi:hypothetical protein
MACCIATSLSWHFVVLSRRMFICCRFSCCCRFLVEHDCSVLFFSFFFFFFFLQSCFVCFFIVVRIYCKFSFNPFTASCENAMTLSVPDVPASCEKFPHSSQFHFWSTESIFNQFSVFFKTLNALCVCLQCKHPRSIKRVIRSDKPVTLLLLLLSHKCDFGGEPRSRIIATSAVKGLNLYRWLFFLLIQAIVSPNESKRAARQVTTVSWRRCSCSYCSWTQIDDLLYGHIRGQILFWNWMLAYRMQAGELSEISLISEIFVST